MKKLTVSINFADSTGQDFTISNEIIMTKDKLAIFNKKITSVNGKIEYIEEIVTIQNDLLLSINNLYYNEKFYYIKKDNEITSLYHTPTKEKGEDDEN